MARAILVFLFCFFRFGAGGASADKLTACVTVVAVDFQTLQWHSVSSSYSSRVALEDIQYGGCIT